MASIYDIVSLKWQSAFSMNGGIKSPLQPAASAATAAPTAASAHPGPHHHGLRPAAVAASAERSEGLRSQARLAVAAVAGLALLVMMVLLASGEVEAFPGM